MLTCIDVLSKFGRVAVIKTKSGASVTAAFIEMIADRSPKYLQTDKGTEFLNATFQKLLNERNITHYTSENDDIKCAVVERWHRTILAKLYRYFTYKNTTRYVDVIQDIVRSYNETKHSTIKVAPFEVNEHNESQIRERIISTTAVKRQIRLKVGDTVRISGTRRAFAKGYRDKWSEEVFNIVKVYDTNPVTFGLADYSGEVIKGKFYANELQKTIKDVYRIEKILKTRRRAGRVEYYVKWLGYSDKFNSWVENIKT